MYYFYFKVFMVCCYFFTGIYLLIAENILPQYPVILKYSLVVIIISYGLFRTLRVIQESKNKDEEDAK